MWLSVGDATDPLQLPPSAVACRSTFHPSANAGPNGSNPTGGRGGSGGGGGGGSGGGGGGDYSGEVSSAEVVARLMGDGYISDGEGGGGDGPAGGGGNGGDGLTDGHGMDVGVGVGMGMGLRPGEGAIGWACERGEVLGRLVKESVALGHWGTKQTLDRGTVDSIMTSHT